MAKIVIKENGELKYREIDEEKLTLLKNEIGCFLSHKIMLLYI